MKRARVAIDYGLIKKAKKRGESRQAVYMAHGGALPNDNRDRTIAVERFWRAVYRGNSWTTVLVERPVDEDTPDSGVAYCLDAAPHGVVVRRMFHGTPKDGEFSTMVTLPRIPCLERPFP